MRIVRVTALVGSAALVTASVAVPALASSTAASGNSSPAAGSSAAKPTCANAKMLCTELNQEAKDAVYGEGHYVGHDEPSTLFYSNRPGSGTHMSYTLTLPKEPPATPIPGKRSYDFMLHPAFWFGLAMCDTQSYPEQVKTCPAGSDANIVDPRRSPNHPGTAFQELQFYSPGYVRQFTGSSCDARKWCAALNIDSLSEDPVNGTVQNTPCARKVLGGLEYINFAYLTKSGRPQGPPDPLHFDVVRSGAPDPRKVVFMNPGDTIQVTLRDSAHGLVTTIHDRNTGATGSMTASAANGFAQMKYAPTGTACKALPYDFHPMYSTSSPLTNVPWAAHTYNVAYSDEIGHFDYCTKASAKTGNCTGQEGQPGDREPADADDVGCLPGSLATLIHVTGCLGTNFGFDGQSYQQVWPDGNTNLHPTPIRFTSPLTGPSYSTNYDRAALEADLPAIETPVGCDTHSGSNCTLIPRTDDGAFANFYPFFSINKNASTCYWLEGNVIPGQSTYAFGKNAQWGRLLEQYYLKFGGHGAIIHRFENFRNILQRNPCPA